MRRHVSTVPVKNEKIEARLTIADRAQLEAAAKREGLPLSVWVRTALSQAATAQLAA